MRRVVITGVGAITSLGNDWNSISENLKAKNNGIVFMEDWQDVEGINTLLGGPVQNYQKPSHFSRKKIRSMGRVSLMATDATERALKQANLLDSPLIENGDTGVAYGSSTGSTPSIAAFANLLQNRSMKGITATSYIKMMPHTAAVNIGVYFGVKGRVITTSSACTSGSQAIGYSYEAIKFGQQNIMIAGGAEELCITEAAVFDTLFATSVKNDSPKTTPSPYDRDRDGLVCGEGACTLILEEYEHAVQRGANILGEIVGYGTNSDGAHVTSPSDGTMEVAMLQALKDAKLSNQDIGYVNGHGTATEQGDIAETLATERAIGKQTPISSLKSYYGHTLGACGAMEAWLSLNMMNEQWFAPTINLNNIDERCGDLDYITGDGAVIDTEYVMTNNFAFGGINTSLIIKRV